MKTTPQRLVALLTIAAVGALTACGENPFEAPPVQDNGVALVVGSSAHEPHLTASQWENAIADHVSDGTTLTLVSADGAADVLATWKVELPENANRARRELANEVTRTAQGASATVATAAETDPWSALAAGRRALGDVAECRLIASSSFLSTMAPVDLPRLGLDVDVTDLATQLTEATALPDLSGCTVVVLALGEAAGGQPALDERGRAMLTALVTTLLESTGATVDMSQTIRGEAPGADLPSVTLVPVVPFAPETTQSATPTQPCRAEIPEAAVGFVKDVETFRDDEAATATITSVAAALTGCDVSALTVFATTSSAGVAADRLDLSMRRARALALPLADALGIDPTAIKIVGLGACESPEAASSPVTCVNDRPNGALDLDLAKMNRRAVVVAGPA